jgi:hypothetical protein
MAPTPQPFSFAGALQLAQDQSLPQDPIAFNSSSQFVSLASEVLNLVGSGTQAVNFGSIAGAGAKGVFVRYDAAQAPGALPILCSINGGSQPLEVTPGGFIAWMNPSPVSGAVSMSIAFTASCQVRVWLLG